MQEFRVFRALGLGLSAWARNFIPITVLAAILFSPVVIWLYSLDRADIMQMTLDEMLRKVFYLPIAAAIGLSALLVPLVTYRIVKHLTGVRVSIMTSMRYGVRGFLPALILAALNIALMFLPAGGLIMAIILTFWFVAAPAAVTERIGPFAALGRSAQLTSGRRWGIFGLWFLLQIIMIAVTRGYVVPMLEDEAVVNPFEALKKASLIVVAVVAIYSTFLGIVQAVSYALLRQDKDGVSHEELARVFE